MATPKFLWKEPERQIVLALLFSISVIMIRDLILTCVGKITSVKIVVDIVILSLLQLRSNPTLQQLKLTVVDISWKDQ